MTYFLILQICAKERYRLKQIEESQKNSKPMNLNKSGASGNDEMGDNQLNSIKEVLQQDSKTIADLVKKLSQAKRDLSL